MLRLFCFVSLPLSALSFVSVSSFLCFFGDVAFSEYFCVITVFSLYGEYVVLVRFFLPGGFFYLVTTGWIFDISVCENSIK